MKRYFLSSIAFVIFSFCPHIDEVSAQQQVPRFEVGGQFSLLSLEPAQEFSPAFTGTIFFRTAPVKRTEPGVGGRFTYNVKRYLAIEAAANIFPRRSNTFENAVIPLTRGGRAYQGQFGVKIGKRFSKLGVFGKARPGFVGFTEVSQLESTVTTATGTQIFRVGSFRFGRQTYPSFDLGGVVETYPSRRIIVRLDLGDTIIRYSTLRIAGIFLSRAILERPPETKHNLQFSAGVGVRF